MKNDEDYYSILGVEPNASIEQIKDAYLYKANILHPDRLAAMTEKVRSMAEKDLKMVNAAYEVLSNPKRKQEYDNGKSGMATSDDNLYEAGTKTKPKPEVYPKIIRFDKALPYVKQKGSFFVRNTGGPYNKLLVSQTPDWLKVVQTKPLQSRSKLPMEVNIEAMGIQWGKVYSSQIMIRLDYSEEKVYVELHIQKKPHKGLFEK